MADKITHDDSGRPLRILRRLGRGGFGSVYLVECTQLDGLVQQLALKILHDSHSQNPQLVARARDEARMMSRVTHENVLQVHSLTSVEGRVAILMEYVDGVDVRTLLRETGSLPPRVSLQIAAHAAAALDAAWHSQDPSTGRPLQLVHRDIKPANLLVSRRGAVKVMDFGVASAAIEREAMTGSLQFGTQRYMAPERWLNAEAGPPADVFALMITLWEMLTGKRFERLPLDPVFFEESLVQRIHLLPDLPGLRELMKRGLAYSERQRPSAGEIEELLNQMEEQAGGAGLPRLSRELIPPLLESRQEPQSQVPESDHEDRSTHPSLAVPPTISLPSWTRLPYRTAALLLLASLGIGILLGLPEGREETEVLPAALPEPASLAQPATAQPAEVESPEPLAEESPEPLAEESPEPLAEESPEQGADSVTGAPGPPTPAQEPTEPAQPAPRPEPAPSARATASGGAEEREMKVVIHDGVRFRVHAEPQEGKLYVKGKAYPVGSEVILSPGYYALYFEGPNWSSACKQELHAGVRSVTFTRGQSDCRVD